jgi:hypothetical protein
MLQSVDNPQKAALKILSFELGILFFNDAASAPAGDSPLQLCPLDCQEHVPSPLLLPLPYCIPPIRYTADEAPWTVDGVFIRPDSVGGQWPTKRRCLYGPNAAARILDESRVM